MNRGVLQSWPVQQMMAAGNPNWWNINNLMKPPPPPPPSSSISSSNSSSFLHHQIPAMHHNTDVLQAQYHINSSLSSWINDDNHAQESLSQLLFGGMFMGEEAKKIGSWEEQLMLHHQQSSLIDQVKQESSVDSFNNNQESHHQLVPPPKPWSHHQQHNYPQINIIPVSSPQSCVTTFSNSSNNNNNNNNSNNSVLDFSSPKSSSDNNLHATLPDLSSECNSTATPLGGILKKARVQPASSQSTIKVRKEKLGDRITALHQLVSPFGKTDTASVLLEAIGYIRFLQSQIQALSLPYLNSGAGNKMQPQNVQGERNCIFPEDPGQLLNENSLKRKGGPDQESYENTKDLRSRGLCLVPVSCTLHVGSDNGADYWAPALGGGFR